MSAAEIDTAPTFTIARLDLRPGDVLVVKTPERISFSQSERIRLDVLAQVEPGFRVIVLDGGLDLAVMTAPTR